VILKTTLSVRFLAPLLIVSGLAATPRLNLVQTALTLSVPAGTNGPTFTLYTFNIGSGSLNLQVTSSVSWLVPKVGTSTVCGLRGGCYPVSIAFQTASLTAGTYTGVITLTDPKAVDSPQTFNITAHVGGDVPSNLVFYLAPGGTATASFTTNAGISTKVNNASWLATSTSPNAASSDYVTTVTATAGASMAASDYNGTITVSASSFSADNKQIAVLLHVTTEPIVQVSSNTLSFDISQSSQSQTIPVAVTNAGKGTLTVSGVSAVANTGGSWLTAATVNGGISVTANPAGLAPNTYNGDVTISNNGVNGNVVLPVTLTIDAQGPPLAAAGGAVNNGTFAAGDPLAQGDIAAVFGGQFTFDAPTAASSLPLQTTLDGVQVLVNGNPAPVYYTSPGQINFEIPINAATGDGTIQVVRNGTMGNLIYVNINAQVPRFILYGGGYGIITKADGATLTGTPQTGPVKVGDTIVIYAIGLGPTSPPVASGTASPASPLAKVPGNTQVCFGVETPFSPPPCTTPLFAGLAPGFVGLYQVNVTIPSSVKSGSNTMSVIVENNIASNSVPLLVQ
jgi:uncharacterized protein (TIGR03437 family)